MGSSVDVEIEAGKRLLQRAGKLPADLSALPYSDRVAAEKLALQAYRAARAAHPLWQAANIACDDGAAAHVVRHGKRVFRVRDCGNGHKEACVFKVTPDPLKDAERAVRRELGLLAGRGEGDREANVIRAARRAKQNVRLACKMMAVNSLWSLTYKVNQRDRDLAMKHLAAFVRRVRKVLPGWRYLAVLERQERGAWHIHLATHALPKVLTDKGVKLKSWDLMRRIWRSVAGDHGGNFDESKGQKRWRSKSMAAGAGAIARYVSKYVVKSFEDEAIGLNVNRYSASEGVGVPETYRAEFAGDTSMHELLELCYAAVGDRITASWFDAEREVFFLETDDSGGPPDGGV
jgi:hypothetical protein